MPSYTFSVNGEKHTVDVDSDTPLLWVLRDQLGLTGTKYSCGIGACGTCTIILDGEAVRSCVIEISTVGSSEITTIEGLSRQGLHPLQKAWLENNVPQCGFCQPGQIITAAVLLSKTPNPSDDQINSAMQGNLCRCGTYQRIKTAIRIASNGGGL